MELCLIFGLLSCVCTLDESAAGTNHYQSFAVYYTDEAPSIAFDSFDLLVFDSDHYPALDTLVDS